MPNFIVEITIIANVEANHSNEASDLALTLAGAVSVDQAITDQDWLHQWELEVSAVHENIRMVDHD